MNFRRSDAAVFLYFPWLTGLPVSKDVKKYFPSDPEKTLVKNTEEDLIYDATGDEENLSPETVTIQRVFDPISTASGDPYRSLRTPDGAALTRKATKLLIRHLTVWKVLDYEAASAPGPHNPPPPPAVPRYPYFPLFGNILIHISSLKLIRSRALRTLARIVNPEPVTPATFAHIPSNLTPTLSLARYTLATRSTSDACSIVCNIYICALRLHLIKKGATHFVNDNDMPESLKEYIDLLPGWNSKELKVDGPLHLALFIHPLFALTNANLGKISYNFESLLMTAKSLGNIHPPEIRMLGIEFYKILLAVSKGDMDEKAVASSVIAFLNRPDVAQAIDSHSSYFSMTESEFTVDFTLASRNSAKRPRSVNELPQNQSGTQAASSGEGPPVQKKARTNEPLLPPITFMSPDPSEASTVPRNTPSPAPSDSSIDDVEELLTTPFPDHAPASPTAPPQGHSCHVCSVPPDANRAIESVDSLPLANFMKFKSVVRSTKPSFDHPGFIRISDDLYICFRPGEHVPRPILLHAGQIRMMTLVDREIRRGAKPELLPAGYEDVAYVVNTYAKDRYSTGLSTISEDGEAFCPGTPFNIDLFHFDPKYYGGSRLNDEDVLPKQEPTSPISLVDPKLPENTWNTNAEASTSKQFVTNNRKLRLAHSNASKSDNEDAISLSGSGVGGSAISPVPTSSE